jgi:hypothetical protein
MWLTGEQQWTTEEHQWITSEDEWEPGSGWVFPSVVDIQRVYIFTLTGGADGLGDITVPISSCQMRRRDGEPTYMSVVVPGYDAWLVPVSNRPNGQMVLQGGYRYSDGSTQLQEIERVFLENIRPDRGARSESISLSGHRTTVNNEPSVVTLTGASYRTVNADGKRRYRCNVDLFLRPGDTADINGESITVGFISYFIGRAQETMEIEEK